MRLGHAHSESAPPLDNALVGKAVHSRPSQPREGALRTIVAAAVAGAIAGAAVVALGQWWLRPPDAAALAAAMRREATQQAGVLSREISDARAELARKASSLALQTVVGSTYVAAGQRGEIVLTCPSGTQPLSGGLKDQDDAAPLREVESFPDGARWILRVASSATQGQHALIAFVVCGSLQ